MATTASHPRFHTIRSVAITGGFLDGLHLDLSTGLNCIIGHRGTGKTTALEFVRYALDAFGEDGRSVASRKRVDALVQGNLGGGRVELVIETRDGLLYRVTRAAGEKPMVLDADGQPTDVSLRAGVLFKADVFSQNEVESIADDPLSQLALIDGFIRAEVDAVESEIRKLLTDLARTAHQIAELEFQLAGVGDEVSMLASIEQKLQAYSASSGGDSQAINEAHAEKALRDREERAVNSAAAILAEESGAFDEQVGRLTRRLTPLFAADVLGGANASLMHVIRKRLLRCGDEVDRALGEAKEAITRTLRDVSSEGADLNLKHAEQELAFRELIEKHKEAQSQSAERTALERKRNELLAKKRQSEELTAQLDAARRERSSLLDRLSELRDERFRLRQAKAVQISAAVGPEVRVRIEQFGNRDAYRELLANKLKGAGVQHLQVADRVANRMSPAELVAAVERQNEAVLIEHAGLNASQAAKVRSTLAPSTVRFELETVEMLDLPRIELKDVQEYKDSLTLSTGQKCTTILPILLLDSENPLLVDQPEDNLDNRFIYDTIVKKIQQVKTSRQMIFVTHNPNIPVLGDAEKVYVLNSDGRQARLEVQGSVDDCKQQIVTLLEGGEEAFRERQRRYAY